MMKVAVVGTGYVGLVTGACLAEIGHQVVCVDTDPLKIARLRKGEIPIYEPGLSDLVKKNAADGALSFTTEVAQAVRGGVDVVFIAVGTPSDGDGSAMLDYVFAAASGAAAAIAADSAARGDVESFTVFVTKSTVPVGTSRKVAAIVGEAIDPARFAIASNPEFLREGSAIEDFMKPDRVVIGASTDEAAELMREIYAPLHSLEIPFVVTNVESAELIKYAANGFLATKITFINEIAVVCEKVGANVHDVAIGMGLDSRIGPKFLQAGPGFGGSCFPKDTSAMADISRRHGYDFQIMEAVLRVNDLVKHRMIDKIVNALGGDVKGKIIGMLGLAFKPETDDMRDSPTITVIKGLQKLGATIRAYDPQAMENAKTMLENVTYCADAYETVDGADAMVLATEWNEFRALNFERVKKTLRQPIVVDLRNVYDPIRMAALGFTYKSVGRVDDRRKRIR